MEKQVTINGLRFVPFINRDEIRQQVNRVAEEVRQDFEGKDPVFLCVLTGAFMFGSDLIREIGINDARINFIRYSSYHGTQSTGEVKQLMGLTEDIAGKDVLVIEDIVDTGLTAMKMMDDLKKYNPASIRFATLMYKPESSKTGFVPDYSAFKIGPKFIIGYGLDLDGKARNLADIYVIKED